MNECQTSRWRKCHVDRRLRLIKSRRFLSSLPLSSCRHLRRRRRKRWYQLSSDSGYLAYTAHRLSRKRKCRPSSEIRRKGWTWWEGGHRMETRAQQTRRQNITLAVCFVVAIFAFLPPPSKSNASSKEVLGGDISSVSKLHPTRLVIAVEESTFIDRE